MRLAVGAVHSLVVVHKVREVDSRAVDQQVCLQQAVVADYCFDHSLVEQNLVAGIVAAVVEQEAHSSAVVERIADQRAAGPSGEIALPILHLPRVPQLRAIGHS